MSLFVQYPDISLADNNGIWAVANPGATIPGSNVSLYDLYYFSYFDGPNGSNTVNYNGWGGIGTTATQGENRIYGSNFGLPANMQNFANLYYFYDNSTFKINLTINNNIPGTNPDIQSCTFKLWDSTKTYNYFSNNQVSILGGTTFGPTTISTTSTPIIAFTYWEIITFTNPLFTGGNVSVTCNGTTIFTGGAINIGGTTNYDWLSSGGAIGNTNGSGLDIVIDFY